MTARKALGKWDHAGLSALKRYLSRSGQGGKKALVKLLRDGGARFKAAKGDDTPDSKTLAATDAERERRREELRSRAAHREYESLVADVRRPEIEANSMDTFSSYRQQMSLGMAAFAGLFSAVAVGYYLGRAMYGPNDGRAWTLGLAFGIVLLLVEMGLLVIQLSRADKFIHPDEKKRK